MQKPTVDNLDKSIDQLSIAFLSQFKGLRILDDEVYQMLNHQNQFLDKFLDDLESSDHEMVKEFSALMKQMDYYRLKVKAIKSDMIQITSRIKSLKERSIKIQDHQVKVASNKHNVRHYEESLIAKK